jgi:hypothetical protein
MWHYREKRNLYRVLVGKPVRKRPLGRARNGWEDDIIMDLREVGWDKWQAVVNTVMNHWLALNARNLSHGTSKIFKFFKY